MGISSHMAGRRSWRISEVQDVGKAGLEKGFFKGEKEKIPPFKNSFLNHSGK